MEYDNTDLKTINNCPLCGEVDNAIPYLSCRDYLVSGREFQMKTCGKCGHIYTNPIPNALNINKYYVSDDYVSHHDNRKTLLDTIYYAVKQHMIKKKISIIKELLKKEGKILDIGCGTGAFLEALKFKGYKTVGVEPGDLAREKAIKKNIEVYKDIADLEKNHPGNFQLISLWHVLEHIEDIKKELLTYHRLLDNKAWLIIAVPLNKSYDALFYKQYWAGFDLPRHLHHFSPETLKKAATSTGFVLQKRKSLPFDSFYVSILSEKYKKALPKPLAVARAMAVGLISNLLSQTTYRPASSEIFLFRKQ